MAMFQPDLVRGEGEWRNIQCCIRVAFKRMDEYTTKQQEQITALTQSVSELRSGLSTKMTSTEIENLVDIHDRKKPAVAKKSDMERIQLEIVKFDSQMQMKPTFEQMNDAIRRIVAKSRSPPPAVHQAGDIDGLQSKTDEIIHRLNIQTTEMQEHKLSKHEIRVLKSQMEDLYKLFSEFPNKEFLERSIDAKVRPTSCQCVRPKCSMWTCHRWIREILTSFFLKKSRRLISLL